MSFAWILRLQCRMITVEIASRNRTHRMQIGTCNRSGFTSACDYVSTYDHLSVSTFFILCLCISARYKAISDLRIVLKICHDISNITDLCYARISSGIAFREIVNARHSKDFVLCSSSDKTICSLLHRTFAT